MKLMVFLGAGVSVPSGLPTAMELTDELFDPIHIADEATARIGALLSLMRETDTADIQRPGLYVTRGEYRTSGAINRGTQSTYEDLYFLCQQIELWGSGRTDHSQTTPFMESLERKAGALLHGESFDARMADLGLFGGRACAFIESIVASRLQRKYVAGLELLRDLASDATVDELSIVTLNHDTLVEQFLSANGIGYADGFGECDGDVRWSDDKVFDEGYARVRLLKLHGSINWHTFQHSGRTRTAIFAGTDLSAAQDASGKKVVAQSPRPTFLSGINKSVSYHRGTYADVHFRFSELLRRCNLMVMSGYGWGDTAINFQFDAWFDRDRTNRLVLLHTEPSQLMDRSMIVAEGYGAWIRSGQLRTIERWLSDTSVGELKGSLA